MTLKISKKERIDELVEMMENIVFKSSFKCWGFWGSLSFVGIASQIQTQISMVASTPEKDLK